MAHNRYTKPLFQPPSRSPNGLGTHERIAIKGLYGLPDPARWVTDYSDFVSGDLASKWAAVLAVGSSTIAQTGGDGGQILFTTGASQNDAASLVKTATTGQNFTFDVTRGFIYEARFQVDDGNLATIGMGFTTTATGPFSYTDGFTIQKAGGATSFKFETQVGSAKTTSAVLGQPTTWVMPTAVMVTAGFAYKGVQTLVNGVVNYEFLVQIDLNDGVGARQSAILVPASAFPANTVKLMPTIGVLASSAVSRTMNVDYVFAAKDRFNA